MAGAPALAAALPASSEGTQCIYYPSGVNVQGTFNCSVTDADANVTLAPFAGAEADAAGGDSIQSNALAQLNYDFEVVGGTAGAQVPLIVTVNLQTRATPHGNADAIINIFAAQTVSQEACTGCSLTSFVGNITTTAVEGEVNGLSLSAESGINATPDPDQSAFASADPMIEVDPSFAGADQYSIVLSPGVANSVEPTPEPGGLWLLAGGVLVAVVRRSACGV